MAAEPAFVWHALIDTAQDPALHPLVLKTPGHQCLISGDVPTPLAAALPYVVRLRPGEPLADAWRDHGSGRNWGILFQTDLREEALRTHFKKFLNVMLPDGEVVLFRFYDPRVFRTFVRSATPGDLAQWFKGITRYSVESETPGQFHDFRFDGERLYDGQYPVETIAA
jgi:Domain of unknown function (DUF4123)